MFPTGAITCTIYFQLLALTPGLDTLSANFKVDLSVCFEMDKMQSSVCFEIDGTTHFEIDGRAAMRTWS